MSTREFAILYSEEYISLRQSKYNHHNAWISNAALCLCVRYCTFIKWPILTGQWPILNVNDIYFAGVPLCFYSSSNTPHAFKSSGML